MTMYSELCVICPLTLLYNIYVLRGMYAYVGVCVVGVYVGVIDEYCHMSFTEANTSTE